MADASIGEATLKERVPPERQAQLKAQNDLDFAVVAVKEYGTADDVAKAAEAVRRIAGKAMARK